MIDLALSRVARGKIMAAQRAGKSIPEGWSLDKEGQPTTDPDAALEGTMIPIGEAKGAALAMMIEILAAGCAAPHSGLKPQACSPEKAMRQILGRLFSQWMPIWSLVGHLRSGCTLWLRPLRQTGGTSARHIPPGSSGQSTNFRHQSATANLPGGNATGWPAGLIVFTLIIEAGFGIPVRASLPAKLQELGHVNINSR